MLLTLEEQLILKTSKYQDDKNTALLLETKDIDSTILEKVLLFATFNDNVYVINKMLKSHKLSMETLLSALWLSVNENKSDAFTELEAFISKTVSKENLKTLVEEFEANENNIQHIIDIIKKFQE